ncbi:MAG: heparan-alpha-glucosaminide N-acetyltransferase domain-containing protein [Ignavibacterium sp.]|nr:heparan-alpha-glucosaminide N-acetyltransferase domain-containing protein [Ignavibacterium sp.]
MKEKVRYISADLLRGLVIIIMIEVHVFNAFLLPELKQTGWFSILNFINGLVAPSFLFVSGFAFQVSSGGKLDEMRKLGKAFWKKMMRIFQIIIIGYALHLPYYSFLKIINKSTPQQLQSFFAVDVLQCIGFGLLFLFLTRLLIKSDKAYHYFLIASLVIVTLISPMLWKIDFNQYVHPLIGNYFNRMHGSLFPIFPWINFLLAGGVFAKYFVDARERNEEEKFIKNVTIAGLVVLLFGHLFYSGLFPKTLTSILPNPVFFLERLGYILVLFYLCWIVDRKTNAKNSFVMDASRESLLVYWLHLIIIYGVFWNAKSLANKIGMTMNVAEAVISTIILIALMIIAAKLWGWVKKKHKTYSTLFVKVLTIVLLTVFFVF